MPRCPDPSEITVEPLGMEGERGGELVEIASRLVYHFSSGFFLNNGSLDLTEETSCGFNIPVPFSQLSVTMDLNNAWRDVHKELCGHFQV